LCTQEEWDTICDKFDITLPRTTFNVFGRDSVIYPVQKKYGYLLNANTDGAVAHPASDFLTPHVSVLTEIGDCKVIKNGGDVIVMTGNVVITLTPPVLKHIQELLNQQQ